MKKANGQKRNYASSPRNDSNNTANTGIDSNLQWSVNGKVSKTDSFYNRIKDNANRGK